MKKKQFFLAGLSLAAMMLSACGQQSNSTGIISEPSYPPLDAALVEEVSKELEIPNADAIYGNIYLPTEVSGCKITWKSSDPATISDKDNGDLKAGVVTRDNAYDVAVKLTATIEKDGARGTFVQEVNVKQLEYQLEDDDYEAYLFAHFVGESYGKTENGNRVATGEQMFFALADVGQGLHFKDMNGSTSNNLKPVLSSKVGERGVRDPFIYRSPEGDTFYLIATDLSVYTRGGWNNNAGQATKTGSHSIVLWESHDLVNWTEERLIEVAREDAGMAWAPEMIYCEETGEYLIFFSSTILDDYSLGVNANIIERDCVYYTTTRDFIHFGPTEKFIPNQDYPEGYTNTQETEPQAINNNQRKIIDGSVMKIGDYYYSAAKDGGNNENYGGILIQRTQNLYDCEAWEKVMTLADLGFKPDNRTADNKSFEGPEWFYYNKADRADPNVPEIGIMADLYMNTSMGYVPWSTTDIEDTTNERGSWKLLQSGETKDFSWDRQTKRHGSILRITAEEAERLKEAYPFAA